MRYPDVRTPPARTLPEATSCLREILSENLVVSLSWASDWTSRSGISAAEDGILDGGSVWIPFYWRVVSPHHVVSLSRYHDRIGVRFGSDSVNVFEMLRRHLTDGPSNDQHNEGLVSPFDCCPRMRYVCSSTCFVERRHPPDSAYRYTFLKYSGDPCSVAFVSSVDAVGNFGSISGSVSGTQ